MILEVDVSPPLGHHADSRDGFATTRTLLEIEAIVAAYAWYRARPTAIRVCVCVCAAIAPALIAD